MNIYMWDLINPSEVIDGAFHNHSSWFCVHLHWIADIVVCRRGAAVCAARALLVLAH
jgi:hypothetical protein